MAATRKVGASARRGNAGMGRKKGTLNKTTASVKQALTEAFEQRGGVPALLKWADESPGEFYKLWGRMLPVESHISGADGTPIGVVILPAIAPVVPKKTGGDR